MGRKSDPDHRIATMSFGAHGLAAEDCLQDVMADIRAFSQEMGVGLPNLVQGFLSPSADFAFLLLSGSAPVTAEKLLKICAPSPWWSGVSTRGYRQIRIALVLDETCLDEATLSMLLASSFSVIDAFYSRVKVTAARAAVTGIIGAVWLRGVICTDVSDMLTILTRRSGMRGIMSFGSIEEIAASMIHRVYARQSKLIGGLFAVILSDQSLGPDQFEKVCDTVCRDVSDDECDFKVSVVFMPSGNSLLGESGMRLSVMRVHAI